MYYPTINMPAGFEVVEAAFGRADDVPAFVMKWLVPGGGPLWVCTTISDKSLLSDDAFWYDMLKRVKGHLQQRNRITAESGVAITNRSPTTGATNGNFLEGKKHETGCYECVQAG